MNSIKNLFFSIFLALVILLSIGCQIHSPNNTTYVPQGNTSTTNQEWGPFVKVYSGHSALLNTTEKGSQIQIQLDGAKNADNEFVGSITITNNSEILFSKHNCYIYPDLDLGLYWICDDRMSEHNNSGEGLEHPHQAYCAYGTMLADDTWDQISILHLDSTPNGEYSDTRLIYASSAFNAQSAIVYTNLLAKGSYYEKTWFFGSEWEAFSQTYLAYKWFRYDNADTEGTPVAIHLEGKKNNLGEFVGTIQITGEIGPVYEKKLIYLYSGIEANAGTNMLSINTSDEFIDNYFGKGQLSISPIYHGIGAVLADSELNNFSLWFYKGESELQQNVVFTTNVISRDAAVEYTTHTAIGTIFEEDTW